MHDNVIDLPITRLIARIPGPMLLGLWDGLSPPSPFWGHIWCFIEVSGCYVGYPQQMVCVGEKHREQTGKGKVEGGRREKVEQDKTT